MYKLLLVFINPFLIFAQDGNDELINPKELIPDLLIDLRYNSEEHKFLKKATTEIV